MKTTYEYEYIFTFESGTTTRKKAYYKDLKDVAKAVLKRIKEFKNPQNVESLEIKLTGDSITR